MAFANKGNSNSKSNSNSNKQSKQSTSSNKPQTAVDPSSPIGLKRLPLPYAIDVENNGGVIGYIEISLLDVKNCPHVLGSVKLYHWEHHPLTNKLTVDFNNFLTSCLIKATNNGTIDTLVDNLKSVTLSLSGGNIQCLSSKVYGTNLASNSSPFSPLISSNDDGEIDNIGEWSDDYASLGVLNLVANINGKTRSFDSLWLSRGVAVNELLASAARDYVEYLEDGKSEFTLDYLFRNFSFQITGIKLVDDELDYNSLITEFTTN